MPKGGKARAKSKSGGGLNEFDEILLLLFSIGLAAILVGIIILAVLGRIEL